MAFIRCAQGQSGPSPTSITPSNSNPPALTANTPVNPTASGYAISSYSNLHPSNVSPKSFTTDGIYKPSVNGYAIQSYTNLTPGSTPTSMSQDSLYKLQFSNGYLIQNYSNITPTTGGAGFSAGMVNMSAGGYAYSQRPSGGSITLSQLSISGKTSLHNISGSGAATVTYTPTQDVVMAGQLKGYNANYRLKVYLNNTLYLDTRAQLDITNYGIFIPKNTTVKIERTGYTSCDVNFYSV